MTLTWPDDAESTAKWKDKIVNRNGTEEFARVVRAWKHSKGATHMLVELLHDSTRMVVSSEYWTIARRANIESA